MGFVLFLFGLVNLVKYCRGQHHIDELEAMEEMPRYASEAAMWRQQDAFNRSQVPLGGAPAAQPHQMSPPLYTAPENLPAPTAPPPQFVQDVYGQADDSKSQFDFTPVEYKRP
jgi:predicted nucleic acid-binding Zn ribbon protein